MRHRNNESLSSTARFWRKGILIAGFLILAMLLIPWLDLSYTGLDWVAYGQPPSHDLEEDWNLISIPLEVSTAPAQVLLPVEENYVRVYAFDGCDPEDNWKLYDPDVPDFVNDLDTVDQTMGLWVLMDMADTLTVEGDVPARTDITLCAGWNLVGYPSMDNRPVEEVLDQIDGEYERVYAYDASQEDPWMLYDPAVPDFVNDLDEFRPWLGYWIKIKDSVEQTTLTIEN